MSTENESTRPIAEAVKHYLDREGWNYETNERNGLVMYSSGVTLPNGEFRTSFDADDDEERFAVFVYSSVYIPEAKRLAVADYLNRVNYTRYLGKIEMDLDDGEVRSVVTVTVADSHLSQAMINHLENAAHFNLNDAYPGLMAIAFGEITPPAAFESYQRRHDAESADTGEASA